MQEPSSRLSKAQCRDAALALVLILLLVAHFAERLDFVAPAIVVLVLALLVPGLFRPYAFVWWGLARVLATVGSKVLLTLIFMLVVTPVGLLRRLFGADPMRARSWRGEGSVFVERQGAFDGKDLEAPY